MSPTRLTVTVYNATETPGLANPVAAVLTAHGVNVTGSPPSPAHRPPYILAMGK